MAAKRARTDDTAGFVFEPPALSSLTVVGDTRRLAIRRVFCIGRNFSDHSIEMGGNPDREPPFFFCKPADAVVDTASMPHVPFPPDTEKLHHECELVVVVGNAGSNVLPRTAHSMVFGYAVGIDLTRRDRQEEAKAARRPWDIAKGFDFSAPIGAVTPLTRLQDGRLADDTVMRLLVNGEERQRTSLGKMIWKVNEIISEISKSFAICAGDVIFTGTPAGVGPLKVGDKVEACVNGLDSCMFQVSPKTASYNHSLVHGVMWPPVGGLAEMKHDEVSSLIKLRATDVWVSTYPKCGTTWVHNICLLLLSCGKPVDFHGFMHAFTDGAPAPAEDRAIWPEIEYQKKGKEFLKTLEAMGNPRVMKTHAPWELLPGRKGDDMVCKAIYVARNPKDAMVSMFYHAQRAGSGFDGSWHQWYELFVAGKVEFGSWFDHTLGWWQQSRKSDQILWVTYEALQDNVHVQIKRIAEFIGVAADDELVARVAKGSNFENMRTQHDATHGERRKSDEDASGKPKPHFFRKGEVGDWRNHFSAQENEEFDRLYKERMEGQGLTLDFGGGISM